jgi:hypothetical protein
MVDFPDGLLPFQRFDFLPKYAYVGYGDAKRRTNRYWELMNSLDCHERERTTWFGFFNTEPRWIHSKVYNEMNDALIGVRRLRREKPYKTYLTGRAIGVPRKWVNQQGELEDYMEPIDTYMNARLWSWFSEIVDCHAIWNPTIAKTFDL